jgi:triacylglycerol esterase/lipase EstA (alpha/beta hydrolase family)
MNKYMVDTYKRHFESSINSRNRKVLDTIYKDMLDNGTRVMLEGKEMYIKKVKFDDGGDSMFNDSYDKPIDQVDFENMSDEEVWTYINGEYILHGNIMRFWGLGATQVDTY